MYYEVTLRTTAACPTAVVAQATTWAEFPRVWPLLLDEVYAFIRGGGAIQSGHNIMLYRDDVPNVEVGVQVDGPFEPSGRVTPSELPGGTRRHHRPSRRLRRTRRCTHGGPSLVRSPVDMRSPGTRWEIYGDWREDPQELETEVSWVVE